MVHGLEVIKAMNEEAANSQSDSPLSLLVQLAEAVKANAESISKQADFFKRHVELTQQLAVEVEELAKRVDALDAKGVVYGGVAHGQQTTQQD